MGLRNSVQCQRLIADDPPAAHLKALIVNDRVKAARQAAYQRPTEDEPITQEEREKINDALRKLYLLTGGSGSA
jgi:hypothetical protein